MRPATDLSMMINCGLDALRAMVGLGEAVAPTSTVDMIARIVPKQERSTAVSLAFTGLHIGSIVGLLAAPILIDAGGWRSLFLAFGSVGLIWYVAFESLMAEVNADDPITAAKLTKGMSGSSGATSDFHIPYRAFARSPAVQALCFTHFANKWVSSFPLSTSSSPCSTTLPPTVGFTTRFSRGCPPTLPRCSSLKVSARRRTRP